MQFMYNKVFLDQDYERLRNEGWVGPSKHNCRRIVFYWLDDDDMFRPCLAIFRS